MSELEESEETWIEEKLIPELKNSLNKSNCTVKYEISKPTDSYFLARVIFLDLKFIDCQEKDEFQINLVVKRPPKGKHCRSLMNIDAAFHNEILFYTKFAKFYENSPKIFYTLEKPPYDSVIVMENINKQEYHLNSEKANLKFEYILTAVRELAKFHANSYILKETCPELFFEIVKNMECVRNAPTEDNLGVVKSRATIPRIIKHFRKENYDETFCEKLEKFLYNGYSYATVDLYESVEPLATVCHGDFTRNNVLFKETDHGITAKLIDFGLVHYGSPGKDLALFLFLSGTRSHRTKEFPEIFETYYETLLECLKEKGISHLERFSREALLADYKSHAFFGYLVVSLYLPVILGYFGNDMSKVLKLPQKELNEIFNEIGGEEFTKLLVDMILDLQETGCLDHVIKI